MDAIVVERKQSGGLLDEGFSTAVPAHIRFPAHDVPGVFLGPSHLDAEHVQGVLVVVSSDCFVYVHKLPVENRCDAVEEREQGEHGCCDQCSREVVATLFGFLAVAFLLPEGCALEFVEVHIC